jgi:membrane protein DedA with SNARE-associated domain
MILQIFYTFFLGHISLLSFIGAFFFGGETLIIFSSLVSNNFGKLFLVFLFGFLGFVCADLMWFHVGKLKCLSRLKKVPYFHSTYKKTQGLVNNLSIPNFFIFLLLCKSLYGIAIPVIMMLGRTNKNIKRFILNDIIDNFILMFIFVFVGWLVGRGYILLVSAYESIKIGIVFILVVVIILYFIKRKLERVFKKDIIENKIR